MILALWVVDTSFVIIFLLLESSLWWLLFFIAHAISVFLSLSYLSTIAEIEFEFQDLKSHFVIGKALKTNMFILACLPLVGPISVLSFAFSLKHAPVRSLAMEKYEVINQDYLDKNLTGIDESYYNLLSDKVIELIHGRQPYEDSRATLNLLDKLKWTPHKTRILQMLLEYSKYPSIIVGAARLINEKRNEILNELIELNRQAEPDQLRLANLYHEIYYIGLVDPHIGHFYLNNACEAIEKVIKKQEHTNLSTYNMAIRYFLENKQIEKAEKFINQVKATFDENDYSSTFKSYFDELAFLKNVSIVNKE